MNASVPALRQRFGIIMINLAKTRPDKPEKLRNSKQGSICILDSMLQWNSTSKSKAIIHACRMSSLPAIVSDRDAPPN